MQVFCGSSPGLERPNDLEPYLNCIIISFYILLQASCRRKRSLRSITLCRAAGLLTKYNIDISGRLLSLVIASMKDFT